MFESWFGRRVKEYCNWIKYNPKGIPTAFGLFLMALNVVEERVRDKFVRFIDWWNNPPQKTKDKGKDTKRGFR